MLSVIAALPVFFTYMVCVAVPPGATDPQFIDVMLVVHPESE